MLLNYFFIIIFRFKEVNSDRNKYIKKRSDRDSLLT